MLHRLCCVSFAAVCASVVAAAAAAQDFVYLRGFEVLPNHVVFGSIDSIRGDFAVLNLGYAHGVKTGVVFVAVRTVQGQLIPIGGLTVIATEADHARARIDGPFRVQVGDFVLAHASHLNLWSGENRFDQLARERLIRRDAANGYNTLDASPDLIDEIARDDSFQQRQHDKFERPKFIPEAAAKVGSFKSRLGAVAPLPAIDPTRPEAREQAIKDSDVTILGLREFLEVARNPQLLTARLTTDRLQTLRLLSGEEVEEDRASLLREVLLTWTKRAIAPQ